MRYPTISQLNRTVRICASADVVVDGKMRLKRDGVRQTMARIEPISAGAIWTDAGRNADDKATHRITVRAMPDLEITRTAWIFEERAVSQNQWYRIVEAAESEDGQWWSFRTMIDNRTDDMPASIAPGKTLARPSGVAN